MPPDAYLQLAEITGRDGRIQEARDALLKYATLVGDEKPLADVATRDCRLFRASRRAGLAVRWFDRAIDEGGPERGVAGQARRRRVARRRLARATR